MLTCTRRFTFDSAHVLPNHPGKCARLHGHTYILEVTIGVGNEHHARSKWRHQGFYADFGDLKQIVTYVLEDWDHRNLNDMVDDYPTAERLILHLWKQLASKIRPGDSDPTFQLVHLKLHETPNNWVEYDGTDPIFSHINIPETEIDIVE